MALLAHLYSHIRGSQEDIATLSLQYILAQSDELNRAFTALLGRSLQVELPEKINYVVQKAGKDGERPDIAGFDLAGHEVLLCEAKFYAGLTSNQPGMYLDRLRNKNGKGLVFICPVARRVLLWARLKELCEHQHFADIGQFCVMVDGVRMSLITWSEIVEVLRNVAAAVSVLSLSDIDQLEAFCKQMDNEAFVPFSAEEFGPETARREERFYQVVDGITASYRADPSVQFSKKGLQTNANRDGYVSHMKINEYGVTIRYDRRMWLDPHTAETPFWVTIQTSEWTQPDEFLHVYNKYDMRERFPDRKVSLAIYPLPDATLDEVVADLKAQIDRYMDDLKEALH